MASSSRPYRNPSLDTELVSPLECSRDMEKIQRLWDETREVPPSPNTQISNRLQASKRRNEEAKQK